MKKLSIFDRKFLALCKVRVEDRRRWSDSIFLQSCGISTALTPKEFQSENKHRDISPCRGCGAHTFEQHAQTCLHRALDGTEQLDGTQQLLVECGLDPTTEWTTSDLHLLEILPTNLTAKSKRSYPIVSA